MKKFPGYERQSCDQIPERDFLKLYRHSGFRLRVIFKNGKTNAGIICKIIYSFARFNDEDLPGYCKNSKGGATPETYKEFYDLWMNTYKETLFKNVRFPDHETLKRNNG